MKSTRASQLQPLTLIALGLLMAALLIALYFSRYLVLTAAIGIGSGVLLIPVVNWMTKRLKVPRGLSVFFVFLLFLLLLTALGFALSYLVSGQLEQLKSKGPQIYESVRQKVQEIASQYPLVENGLQRLNTARIRQDVMKWALGGLQMGLSAIAGSVIVLALALFTAVHSDKYLKGLLTAFPAYQRPRAKDTLQKSASALREWFAAQLLDMLAVGAVTALGLLIIGVDYWLVLGFLSGALDIIPYVGPITAALLSGIVTLGTEPDKLPWVLGLYLVIQQVEGNILIPIIMRGKAELPEVHLIVLIMVLSYWFGLLGALIAAPLLAVGRTIYLNTYKVKMDEKAARSPQPGA